jgi:HD superfamily phosphodiesterase
LRGAGRGAQGELAVSAVVVAPDLVETPLERRFLDKVREVTGEPDSVMERHGLRCFLLIERLATRRGIELDREVALCAALVHDIGIYPSVSHGGVYTDESGELAQAMFREAGASEERARLVADACAYHHALRAQWPRGAEVELMRLADQIEVFAGLVRNGLERSEIREGVGSAPRQGFYGEIGRLALRAARDRPLTLPRIFRL